MELDTVMQLQALNSIMADQFYRYQISTIMILGIAGGNGLNHINASKIQTVYGVDINSTYLEECAKRYKELDETVIPVQADLQDEEVSLPKADIVVANLLVEYIGYENFQNTLKKVNPKYVSCVIQVNPDDGFVSDSPYLHAFDDLEKVHNQIHEDGLTKAMEKMNYKLEYKKEFPLPNGKKLVRLDYQIS